MIWKIMADSTTYLIVKWDIIFPTIKLIQTVTQSAEAVEYPDCISAEG